MKNKFNKKDPKPGVYEIASEVYHGSPGLSRTDIHQFMKGPDEYEYWNKFEKNEKKYAMELGSALHLAVLEPERFEENVLIGPTKTDTSKAWIEMQAEQPDKYIIKEDDYNNVPDIVNAVRNDYTCAKFLSEGKVELSHYWQDPMTKTLLKCRPDLRIDETGSLVDFKFVARGKSSEKEFNYSVMDYGYFLQAPMYLEGVRNSTGKHFKNFFFAVVEKEPPFHIEIIRLNDEYIMLGEQFLMTALDEHKKYITDPEKYKQSKKFIKVLEPPYWAMNKLGV